MTDLRHCTDLYNTHSVIQYTTWHDVDVHRPLQYITLRDVEVHCPIQHITLRDTDVHSETWPVSVFTALHGMQKRYSDGNSVCLSVRQTRAL